MIQRQLKSSIQRLLSQYPAIALVGPRQVGKTTLAKTFSSRYFDLELESERLRLDLQWQEIIQSADLIIFDEAQNDPGLFPRLRNAIDSDRKRNARFLLLGSVSPSLMENVSEFLTGRIALCELTPFSVLELKSVQINDLWLKGGYPDGGILNTMQYPVWQLNYLDLLAMRDLPGWGLPAKPQMTKRFFKIIAAANAQLWNASQIGKSLGLSYHTVNTYLDFLEHTFLIRKIQPFHTNIRKRLIKSPKIYWRDTGLLHALHNISSMNHLLTQPWVGLSWENWIIEQILIHLNNRQIQYDGPYFLRTSDGLELDLILIVNNSLWAIEIKLTTLPKLNQMDGLNQIADMISADKSILISQVRESTFSSRSISCNITDFLNFAG